MNISNILSSFNQLEKEKNNSLNFESNLNITSIQSLFLQNLIKALNPNSILEFGTSNGYSLFSMILPFLQQNDIFEKSFTSIEINLHQFKLAQKNLSNLIDEGINIQLINADMFNEVILKQLSTKNYDFIFVDCNQSEYEKVLQIIEKYDLLSNDGCIIFENVLSHKMSYDFYESLKLYENYKLTLYELHNGFLKIEKNIT